MDSSQNIYVIRFAKRGLIHAFDFAIYSSTIYRLNYVHLKNWMHV